MANYNSNYTGAQIDSAVGKANNPDTTPTANSGNLITSNAVAVADAAIVTQIAGIGGLRQAQAISANTDLDNIDVTGAFYSPNGATTQTLVHCPVTNAFAMLVLSRGASRLQVIFNGSTIHSRTVGGSWTRFTGEVV